MPPWLIVVCAILLCIAGLLALRVKIVIEANERVSVSVRLLLIRIRLYPRTKKIRTVGRAKRLARRRGAAGRGKKKRTAPQRFSPKALLEGKTLSQKVRFLRGLCAWLVRRTKRHLHLYAARLHIRVATGDAATTAVAYGAVSQSVAYLLGLLSHITRLHAREPQVAVQADFTGERSSIDAKLVLSVRVLWLLGILFGMISALFRSKGRKRGRKNGKNTPACKKGT